MLLIFRVPVLVWPRSLRRRSAAARLLRLWVRIPAGTWMSVCCECCVLSGRGICDELITRPEESYWRWCVVECDLETSWMRRPWPNGGGGCRAQKKNRVHLWKVSDFIQLCGEERKVTHGCLVTQFTMLSVTQTIQSRMLGWVISGKLENILRKWTWPHPGITLAFISLKLLRKPWETWLWITTQKCTVFFLHYNPFRKINGSVPPLSICINVTALSWALERLYLII
jgi:hypothetical protein